MELSLRGERFIKGWEVLKLEAYMPTPNDRWTIGWGHTRTAYKGLVIDQITAQQLYVSDVSRYIKCVNENVEVHLSQHQFDALVSFCFNVGRAAFKRSTLLKELNNRHYDRVPHQLRRWNKQDGEVVDGLTYRRDAEVTTWNMQPMVVNTSLRPELPNGKPLRTLATESKTMKAAGVGGVMIAADKASDLTGQASTISDNLGVDVSVIAGIGVAGVFGYLIYNRLRDSRIGRAY